VTIDEKLIRLAREHPRGTELRTLGPYRTALNDPAAYAALPIEQRDVIVRWAETRRLIRDAYGVDADQTNLADPLVPAERLRAQVLEGESLAVGREAVDDAGDLVALVRRIRTAELA